MLRNHKALCSSGGFGFYCKILFVHIWLSFMISKHIHKQMVGELVMRIDQYAQTCKVCFEGHNDAMKMQMYHPEVQKKILLSWF